MPKQINVKLGFEADTSQAKKQIQDLQKSLDSLMTSSTKNTALGDFSKGMVEAQQSAVKLKSILGESMNVDTGRLDLVKFNQQLQDSGLTLSKLGSQLSSLGPEGKQAFLSLADSIVTAQKPMIETNRLLDGMWTALKNTARWQLSSSILHGFMSSLQGAYGYAQDLNASLNSIRIVSGQSVEQMAKFADQANRSAQALSTSTLAYTDAALIFYQQGLTGDQVTERTDTVLKLSNVTGDSAEQVSSYMTAIWNNFYDGSESLESFADKITALGAATASSSAEIAAGLQQFASIGNTVGLSYDYAATALATIVAQTRQSESTVGNGLRTIFARLSSLKQGGTDEDGTDLTKYTKALAEYGIQVKDENNNLKEMDQILEEIGAKWQTLSDTQKVALAQTVGGVRQYATIMALFDNWDKFQENLAVAQGAEGTLQKQADIYAESWEAARKRVQAAWQAIYQDLIDDKFFITILNGIASILKGVDGLIDSIGGLKGVLGAVGVAATTLFNKQLETGIKGAITNLNKIFYGDQIAADLAEQAKMAALEQKGKNVDDAAQNTLIDNQILQIDLNEQIRKKRAELKDEEVAYYQALMKTSEELAKQSSLATETNIQAGKRLDAAQEDVNYKIYSSDISMSKAEESNYIDLFNGRNISSDLYQKAITGDDEALAIANVSKAYREQAEIIGIEEKELVALVKAIRAKHQAEQEDAAASAKSNIVEQAVSIAVKDHKNAKESLEQAIDNAIAKTTQEIEENKEDAETVKSLVKRFEELREAKKRFAEDPEGNYAKDLINDVDKEINGKSVGINIDEKRIVQGAQAVSQLTMAITALASIWDVINDDSIPIAQKLTRVLTSLTMALPALISGIKNLAIAFGLVNKEATFLTALGALSPYLLIATALGVAAWGISKGLNAAKDSLDKANKALEEATQKAEETKQAYDNLKSTFESYKDLQENLSEMDELDRAQAISEMNSEMLDLILNTNNWSEAFKDGIQYDENGLIKVDELQQELLRKEEAKAYFVTQRLETEAKIAQLHADEKVDDQDLGFNFKADKRFDNGGYLKNADRTSDVINALADAGLTNFVNLSQQYKEELNKLQNQNLTEEEDKQIRENLTKIREQLDKQNNDIVQALTDSGLFTNEEIETLAPQINEIIGNDDQLNSLVEAILNHISNDEKEDVLEDTANRAYLSGVENKNASGETYNAFGELDSESQQKVLDWYQTLGKTQKDYFDEAMANGDGLIQTIQALEKDYEDLEKISDELYRKEELKNEIIHGNLSDTDIDEEEFANLSDFLSEYSGKIEGLSDQLRDNKEAANDVAEAILRFDDAIQDVEEHYDDWMHTMSTGSMQDRAEAIAQMKDAYADMLDVSEDAFKNIPDFLESTENLELMKQAADGVAGAYEQLQQNLQHEIIVKAGMDDSEFQSKYGALLSQIDTGLKDIEVGASLNDAPFIDALNNMINAMHLTEAEAEALIGTLGIDADVEQVEVAEPQETKYVDAIPEVTPKPVYSSVFTDTGMGETNVGSVPEIHYDLREQSEKTEGKKTTTMLRIKNAKKAAGGNFKYSNAKHGGGSQGPSASKGGGGGGGSSPKKKTVKEHKKPEKKEDRYHDIKERIEDLNTELKRLAKTEDRVYGKSKLKYMDQEIEKLEKQIKLTDEYIKEIKEYAAIDQANLRGINMGATFDENGRLNNYEQVLANIVNTYNGAVAAYNGAVDNFNASAQEDADSAALEAAEKTLSAAKETYDERLKILKQYEDTYNLLQQKMDERIDQVWELFDKRLEKITWRIEFELDWNEKELDHFDWLLKYIGKDADHASDAIANLSKQMGIYEESIDWAKKGIADIFDLHGVDFDFDNADPNYLYDRLLDFMHLQGLESEMTEKEAEALIDYMDVLRDSYDGMYDAWEEAHEHMMNAWDEWNERIGDAIYDIQQYGEELENIQKIVDLTGRKLLKMSTQDLNKMNQTIVVNAQENLRATKAHLDAMEQAVADSAAAYQRSLEQNLAEDVQNKLYEEWRQMKEDYDDALNDYYNAWEDTLQKGEDAFKRYMEALTQDYNNSFGQMDLDYMIDQFDRQKEVRDLYLDDYQKYHELNKTAQELNKSLAATNNELIRGKLLDLQDELNAAMGTGVQISAAQAEIYARRVALLQAEAELLDAQNAKSAVRMTRDNEGNFSYTYTADQEQIGEAQENYGDSFYELLEFERNYMDEIQSDMLAKRKEFMDRLNEISEMYWDDQDAYNQALMDLREEYLAYCDYYVGEQEMDLYEMERLRDEDWMDFQDITGLKLAEHDDFITFFKNTIYGDLANAYDTARQDGLNWQGVMEATTAMATQAVNNYQINTKRTYEMAGQNIDTYATKVENDFDDIADKSSDTADAVDDMGKDMATTMSDIQSNAWDLDSAWGTVMDSMRNQINQTVSALQTLLQKLQEVQSQAQATIAAVQAAAAMSAANGYNSGISGDYGNYSGSGNTNPGGPSYTPVTPPNKYTLYDDHGRAQGTYNSVEAASQAYWADKHRDVSMQGAFILPGTASQVSSSSGYVKHFGYASGGYTGAWGSEGKLAVLHEKELVLNKDDTSNMLSMVNIVRGIVDTIGSNGMLNTLALAAGGATGLIGGLGAGLEQQVHIEANFPNVQSHTEIETALNNLINSASQYVNRKS